ncbi:DUF3048 domain-containing protein [Alteribacter keqinensis]|uniref:DUF3048 domain-containing protein n=1 Tax=Alteribacter keqinensis TaxID=2483800 RepID=A0A3M7TMP6_9BACI|nr:DUF3048 domain-containing protein [Alteribacter keqinensis]RNA66732.1 DUF3048 domain-containing protein [Alteribacter keqinensis]
MIASKKRVFLCGAIACMLLTGACSKNEATGTELDEADDIAAETTVDEDEDPVIENAPYTEPLTGIGTEEELTRSAFGVMIENSTHARPQTGLYQADVVYEVLSEASITRFLAFYHSQEPDTIGPVRSARDYYVHLNKGYGAIYVSAGGSPDGLALAEGGYVPFISGLAYDGRYFTRSSDRSAPHNMYTSFSNLEAAAEKLGYDMNNVPPSLPYTSDQSEGKKADRFEVKYGSTSNNVQYAYDDELGGFRRSNGGVPTEDAANGTPVAPKNVFVLEASHRVIDDAGRRDIDLSSGGKAYLFQEGVMQELEWRNENGVILPYKDNEPAGFVPGQTWINIVPKENGGLSSHVAIEGME